MNGEKICDQVFERLEKAGKSLDRLEPWEQCVVRIYSAQGVLDNGGYRYFFESDWEGQPDYSVFVQAYREIGCEAQAQELARVVATFDFADPHLHQDLRNRYMDERFDEESYEVRGWGDALCGDPEVYSKVHAYAARHHRRRSK